MIALALVIASMAGCASTVPPADPVPVTRSWSRCDPARLGWAPDGSFWFDVQHGVAEVSLLRRPLTRATISWSIR